MAQLTQCDFVVEEVEGEGLEGEGRHFFGVGEGLVVDVWINVSASERKRGDAGEGGEGGVNEFEAWKGSWS